MSLVLFALLITLIASILVGFGNYRTDMSECAQSAYAYARAAARFIDGDRVLGYLGTSETDENGNAIYRKDAYYEEVMSYLVSAQSEYALMKYFYVFVPYEDNLVYVWDVTSGEDARPLGYAEEYMDGGKETLKNVYRRDPIEEISIFHDDVYGNIACAYYPIFNGDGQPVAIVGVDLSLESIRHKFFSNVLRINAAVWIATLIACAIGFFVIRRTLVRPIQRLNAATKGVVENLDTSLSMDLEINTNDELQELAGSFSKMNADLRTYIERLSKVTAEKERIGAELNIATQIQADMLPHIFPPFPDRKEFELYASMTPAKEVGGDFYDFFLIDDDHLCLVMADVSGKGIPAALFMVIAKTLIKNRAQLGESPSEILRNVNEQLMDGNEAELFVTVWLAIIEISTGKGVAANAGHEHPVLRRAGGRYEPVIYRHSPAVAAMEGIKFREHSFELYPGYSLFVYTDGVLEATAAGNELFGMERMLASLNREPNAPPRRLLGNLREDIDRFVGESPQFDDITMMCLHYSGTAIRGLSELTLDAKTENLEELMSFIAGELDELDFPAKNKKQIEIAVEELFVNIAHYAYTPFSGSATVRVDKREQGQIVITFIDRGMPFNPLNNPEPDITLSAEDRQIGGLGIYMVKQSMDEVAYEYRNGENILTIKKGYIRH